MRHNCGCPAAGSGNYHNISSFWEYFEVYGFVCEEKGDLAVVSLTGTIFVNHAPQRQEGQHTKQQQQQLLRSEHVPSGNHNQLETNYLLNTANPAKGAAGPHAQPLQSHGKPQPHGKPQREHLSFSRTANSGGAEPWASPWEQCTVGMALRDIKEGEEILEDYNLYSPPCKERGNCATFYQVSCYYYMRKIAAQQIDHCTQLLLRCFMICHSQKCHRPRTSSLYIKQQRGGTSGN